MSQGGDIFLDNINKEISFCNSKFLNIHYIHLQVFGAKWLTTMAIIFVQYLSLELKMVSSQWYNKLAKILCLDKILSHCAYVS